LRPRPARGCGSYVIYHRPFTTPGYSKPFSMSHFLWATLFLPPTLAVLFQWFPPDSSLFPPSNAVSNGPPRFFYGLRNLEPPRRGVPPPTFAFPIIEGNRFVPMSCPFAVRLTPFGWRPLLFVVAFTLYSWTTLLPTSFDFVFVNLALDSRFVAH